ncbi:MAG: hypothetical protein ACJAZQ_001875, partial [Cognaticolwellia sp.]
VALLLKVVIVNKLTIDIAIFFIIIPFGYILYNKDRRQFGVL